MKKLRQLLCIMLIAMTLASFYQPVYANEEITVVLDGKKLNFDVQPQLINGRTMVPFRKIFEALGAEVEYNEIFNEITAKMKYFNLDIRLNDYYDFDEIFKITEIEDGIRDEDFEFFSYGDFEFIPTDVRPIVIEGRTLVPVRIVSEILGCNVEWDESTQTVNIKSVKEDGCYVTVYNADGQKKRILISEIDNYRKNQWFLEPCQTFYGLAGDTTVGPVRKTQEYVDLGWYAKNETKLYAPDGRELVVSLEQVKPHLNVGWYMEPVTSVYTLSGKCMTVKCSELDEHIGVDWYREPMRILHSSDSRAIVVGESEVEAYKKVGWYDKDDLKAKYLLTSEESLKDFIKTFYPVVVTATGRYSFDVDTWEFDGVLDVDLEYDYNMIGDATYNVNMGVEQRVQAKKDIKQFMYILANDIMARTTVPIEIQFLRGGYEYPTLKVGYNATRFLTAKNYKDEYVTASDGSSLRTRSITGFYWYPAIDDYDF